MINKNLFFLDMLLIITFFSLIICQNSLVPYWEIIDEIEKPLEDKIVIPLKEKIEKPLEAHKRHQRDALPYWMVVDMLQNSK